MFRTKRKKPVSGRCTPRFCTCGRCFAACIRSPTDPTTSAGPPERLDARDALFSRLSGCDTPEVGTTHLAG